MTRIGSYDLYACPKCSQAHIKSNYSSISISMPRDAWLAPTDMKVCHKCGSSSPFSEYQYVKSVWVPPGGVFQDGCDPRKLYPYFGK